MADKKLTDAEIVNALECMTHPMEREGYCHECAFGNERWNYACRKGIAKASLDLINRQKAEIERLQNSGIRANSVDDWLKHCNELRAEAIQEFADKIKADAEWICDDSYIENDLIEYVDNLVKEMVGETDGSK